MQEQEPLLFKMGDEVTAYGLNGIVSSIVSAEPGRNRWDHEVIVRFHGHDRAEFFDGQGYAERWHREPALELTKRPVVRLHHKRYLAFYKEGGIDSVLHLNREAVEKDNEKCANFAGTKEIEIVVEV